MDAGPGDRAEQLGRAALTIRVAAPRYAERFALALLLGLALGVRSLGLAEVFIDGETVLRLDESQYHARRAAYTFVHFPQVLEWDPYLNYPDGADVPWPPLYDLALGSLARLVADDVEQVPRVIAWVSVVLGGLTALLVYAIARSVGSTGEALGAVAVFALLRASTIYSEVGNVDHHAAVALTGTAILALHAKGAQPGVRLGAVHAGLVAARLAMLLLWHGSLLYLAAAEITAVLVLAGAGRRRALLAEAVGAAATALLVAPFALGREPGLGGPFSPIELSRLHVTALLGVAVTAAGAAGVGRWRPGASVPRRLLGLAALGLIAAAGLLLVPGLTEGLRHALDYGFKETAWIAGNTESQPIFRGGSAAIALILFGGFAFLVPLSPLGPLARARDPELRAPALVLMGFTAVFCALALSQSRYGNDFAPGGSVALVLLLSEGGRFLSRRLPGTSHWPRALPALLGVVLLWPLISAHAERVPGAMAALLGERTDRSARRTPHATVHRFAKLVREATPETSGYFDPDATPEYGVLSFAGIGHVFQRVARRPTPSDNFGPYLANSHLAEARRFYALVDEQKAVAIAKRLKWRYVVTAAAGRPRPTMLLHRLHWADGSDRFGAARLEHFRLVTEGPRAGLSIGHLTHGRPKGDIPYKLFEIVPGALLRVRAEPGSSVVAEVEIGTPTGRRFSHRATAGADSQGIARLRVPYATDTEAPVRPLAPYRVRAGERVYAVELDDAEVREGAVIDLDAATRGARGRAGRGLRPRALRPH